MKALQRFLIGLAILLALLVAASFALPRTAHVERSATIGAPQATVFTVLNGFRQFRRWSPWSETDPDARYEFSGPAAGVGARMRWSGNEAVGSGMQEIVESAPFARIRVKLEFSGFEGTDSVATFTLARDGGTTRVTWALDADFRANLAARWFGLLFDRMVGPDYERGLERLKALAESLPQTDFADLPMQLKDVPPMKAAFVATGSARDDRAVGVALGVAYGRISGFMNLKGLKETAPPVAVFEEAGAGSMRFDAGIPIDRTDVPAPAGIRYGETPSGLMVKAVHRGPYRALSASHGKVAAFLAAAGYRRRGAPMEQYVTDPVTTPDTALVTHLFYPVE
ncbi:MAG TPA: SRPBCC family protein [Candidatus Binatia bacterium]|nr:SRPBCC family protein [Candidatus Binatia bacterium]